MWDEPYYKTANANVPGSDAWALLVIAIIIIGVLLGIWDILED